jgi:hypothetical protein
MARIFVSYRRQDSRHFARVLKTRIESRFGNDSVFLDLDAIPIGVDFQTHVEAAIGQCQAMLLVIGDKWLATDGTGKNRLFAPHDTVRMEIATALARKVPIVPVLVDDATMPTLDDLPDEIRNVTSLNAATVRDADFEHHMTRLESVLEKLLQPASTRAQTANRLKAGKTQSAATPVVKVNVAAKRDNTPGKKRKTAATKTKPVPTGKRAAGKNLPCLTLTSLRRAFKDSENTFVGSSIPPVKLLQALGAYASDIDMSDVLLLYDSSFFGGAKNGFLLTRNGIYWHNLGESAHRVEFRNLKRVADNGGDVVVNGKSISIDNFICAGALTDLLEEIMKNKS